MCVSTTVRSAQNDVEPPATPLTPASKNKYRDEFMRVDHMEPHLKRRYEILRKYPQIKELEGYCPRTRYICSALVVFQLTMAWYVSDKPWYVLLPLAWIIGGTINHCLSLAGHELSHGLGFKTQWHNDAFAFVCNVAMGFPSAITFRKYHHLHHLYQGVDHIDTDIPTDVEAKIVLNNYLTKFMFLVLQPAFYALRPQIMYPLRRTLLENVNWAIVFTTNFLVWYNWGGKALFYLMGGTLLGLSLHPMAGHFLAEHYVWDPRYETHSYYGPLNFFAWNVGYHVEHHDFPRVPGSRLPKLHEIAKEYYPVNPKYQSWVAVMWNFVVDSNMGSYNRIKRTKEVHNRDRKRILEQHKVNAADEKVSSAE